MTEGGGAEPSVGNVLGFTLLLREKRALVRLDRRTLAPGVHLLEFEAAIPGVKFPLEGPLSAQRFRHRRTHVEHLALEVELRALQAWLGSRLRGRRIGGVLVEQVELDTSGRPLANLPESPCLYVSGTSKAGAFAWVLVALRPRPRPGSCGCSAASRSTAPSRGATWCARWIAIECACARPCASTRPPSR
jgi:hypothetical protein